MIPNLVAPPSISTVFVVPAIGSTPSRLPFSHAAPSDNGRLFRRRRHRRPAEWFNRLAPSRGEGGSTDRADGTVVVVVVERRDDNDIGRGGFNSSLFASLNCWGCRPLLVRGAYDAEYLLGHHRSSSFASWPTWEEVVDIASDVDSESRVISHVPGDLTSFEVRWGPLTSREVRSWLSKKPVSAAATAPIISDGNDTTTTMRKETLVVNDVDRYHPPLADWIRDEFRFLPNWRMDDGQISLAEMGGGIGPHVDDYDVFLIQMTGTRTWRIGRDVIGVREELDRTIDRMDVRILADRDDVDGGEDGGGRGMDEFTVHPGDVLYLPPRIAHCGTSLSDDCTTLSVGCRAPSVSDLVSKLAERLSSSMDDSAVRRYTDSDLLQGGVDTDSSGPMSSSPGELTRKAKERARRLVKDSLASIIDDDLWWDEFFGRYATEQKRARVDYPIPLEDSDADDDEWGNERSTVLKVLEGKGVLYQAEGIVFAYSSIPSKLCPGGTCHRCYVNGEMWQSETQSEDETNGLSSLFRIVSNHRRLDRSILLGYVRNDDPDTQNEHLSFEAISFLEELVSSGVLYGSTA